MPRVGHPPSSLSSLVGSDGQQRNAKVDDDITTKSGNGNDSANNNDNGNDDDDDDDGDIDWEDGDDGFEDDDAVNDSNEHFDAVERTLAAMESAGGLRGGEIEINFGHPGPSAAATTTPVVAVAGIALEDTEQPTSTIASAAAVAASNPKLMTRLKKCLRSLSGRHVPRISMWLDGLTNAGNLVLRAEHWYRYRRKRHRYDVGLSINSWNTKCPWRV